MKAAIDLIMVCAGTQGPGDKAHIPLALLYVGTALKKAGYDVRIWHLLPEEFEAAVSLIQIRGPVWIGLSVLSGMTTLYAADLSRIIKKRMPETKIVWGGHHTSAIPGETLRAEFVDFVVFGEGERTAVELSDQLVGDRKFEKVSGLGFKTGDGRAVLNKQRPFIQEIDQFELDWELLEPSDYFQPGPDGNVRAAFFSSRGCPYKCAFCATPSYTGKLFRGHSPEFVERNFAHLQERYGVNQALFADDNFMIDSQRAFEIIRRLTGRGIRVTTLDVRLNQLSDKVLKRLADFGVYGLFFGFESGNDRILRFIRKGITVDTIVNKAKLIREYKIPVWASSIVCLPSETREEAYDTIDLSMWLRDTLPEGSTVSNFRYMPLPNTKLLEAALQEGFEYPQTPEDWKRIDPVGPYYSAPWVKWLTERDMELFSTVQELGRAQMLNFSKVTSLPSRIRNRFVSRLRRRASNRTLAYDWEVKAFGLTMDLYQRVRYGRSSRLKSKCH